VGSLLRRSKTEGKGSRGTPALGVLVVNDDEDSCELLCRVLQHTGGVAFRAHSAEGAVDELLAHRQSVQAIVLDFSSGAATSVAVLETIRDNPLLREKCVMIITTTDTARSTAFAAGADEFLVRPFHVDEFTSAVGDMLARTPEERSSRRLDQAGPEPADDA